MQQQAFYRLLVLYHNVEVKYTALEIINRFNTIVSNIDSVQMALEPIGPFGRFLIVLTPIEKLQTDSCGVVSARN